MLTKETKEYLKYACCAGFDVDQIQSNLKEFYGVEYDDEAAHWFDQYCQSFDSIWADPDAEASYELMWKLRKVM